MDIKKIKPGMMVADKNGPYAYAVKAIDYEFGEVILDNGVHVRFSDFHTGYCLLNENKEMAKIVDYTNFECLKLIKSSLSPEEYKGFLRGSAINLLCNGNNDTQMLNKAIWFIDKLIEEELNG